MPALGQQLGTEGLLAALRAFGLSGEAGLPGAPADVEAPQVDDLELATIGQDVVALSPLQLGVALAALANDGRLRPARLVAASQNDLGEWQAVRPAGPERQAVPAQTAQEILTAFNLQQGIREQALMVLSGPEGELNSWYLGLAPADEPRFGVVVVVEEAQDVLSAAEIGRNLLKSVLDPGQL
jgi:peptidoglycan glycosyltransferase